MSGGFGRRRAGEVDACECAEPGAQSRSCCWPLGLMVFHTYERHQNLSRIHSQLESVQARQAALKIRFDALLAESAKAPNDPVLLKTLGAKHLELVKDEDAIKRELNDLQKEIDANRQ
jgi:hypothetical protein